MRSRSFYDKEGNDFGIGFAVVAFLVFAMIADDLTRQTPKTTSTEATKVENIIDKSFNKKVKVPQSIKTEKLLYILDTKENRSRVKQTSLNLKMALNGIDSIPEFIFYDFKNIEMQ
jgi:hypothetical protein